MLEEDERKYMHFWFGSNSPVYSYHILRTPTEFQATQAWAITGSGAKATRMLHNSTHSAQYVTRSLPLTSVISSCGEFQQTHSRRPQTASSFKTLMDIFKELFSVSDSDSVPVATCEAQVCGSVELLTWRWWCGSVPVLLCPRSVASPSPRWFPPSGSWSLRRSWWYSYLQGRIPACKHK